MPNPSMWYVTITNSDGVKSVFKYRGVSKEQALIKVIERCYECGISVVSAEVNDTMPFRE